MKWIAVTVLIFICAIFGYSQSYETPYGAWSYSGSFYIITDSQGADLPESAAVYDFPLLVRLNSDHFDFSEAESDGRDIRFTNSKGLPLSYQIEEWDALQGTASIWVRIPLIKGNSRQEIKIYWGNDDAKSESSGASVFNESNDYLSVWHMSEPLMDEVGTLKSEDRGTVPAQGIVGSARGFSNGSHIFCGDEITSYPSGNEERTTSAWIYANKPGWAVDWGMEARCQENSIKLEKPPVLKNEGYLCDVFGNTTIDYREWNYATVTYKGGELIVYLNGEEDGRSERSFVTPDTSYLRIGKRHNSPDNPWGRQWWDGAIDEVRISKIARSADWIKLEYENQNALQKLVGPIVQKGDYFTVPDNEIQLLEGDSALVRAQADGAQKLLWILKEKGQEKIVAVDRLTYTYKPGRVSGDMNASIIFKAIYPDRQRSKGIPIIIRENIPDPVFELKAPVHWNGRDTIEVIPEIGNFALLKDNNADDLNFSWQVSDIAVIKEIEGSKLVLKRAQNSGLVRISLAIDNGGPPNIQTIAIKVEEPNEDPWIRRIPGPIEKPLNNQFYARENDNKGTVYFKGRLRRRAQLVIMKIYAGERLYFEEWQKPGKHKSYSFQARIEAGLVRYTVELWSKNGDALKLLHTASNVVCGDAYIINGQSNAEAYDYGRAVNPYTSNWVRSYGSSSGDPEKSSLDLWGNAVSFDRDQAKLQIGYWGIELGKILVMRHKVPVCFINGAVGGSRIDQHQRNHENPEDPSTIYGRLLRRVNKAGLSHGIRGILWHQGENDQGAAGPIEGYGWEHYEQYFIDLAAAWKEDYPNIQNYYIFQIWPDACSMGRDGSGDRLREVQRKLPSNFSNMSIMSTLGIRPGGGCHFPAGGYAEMARLIAPMLERDHHGKEYEKSISPPNLQKAYFTSERKDRIAIEFDQPMDWNPSLVSEFYLDGESGWVASGSLWGNKIILKLKGRSNAKEISYLDGKNWNEDNILYGLSGIAALTFYEVPILTRNILTEEPEFILERSPIAQPYSYISSGSFAGSPVPESPDPLVAYRWPEPRAEDGLEVFILKPVHVDTDSPESFEHLPSLTGDKPLVKVRGRGSIRLDFGVEMPAWIEFDSPDYQGGVEMSISEYNQPGINKTRQPEKHGDTYRLTLNDELYDGVRYAWIHVRSHSSDWHISNVRAVNQVKPTNYNGSFSCSDQMLTRIWYSSAYSVKASLCRDYFGAILMERGDRMSWTGDAHPIQAASLVAFGNYDFIRKNIDNTATQNNGIRSYSLYWILSLLDYFYYTGDRETLELYIQNASNKLDEAYIEFGTDPDLRFYGWDERLCAGFELWFKPAPEAQNAYKMLTIRAFIEFASAMEQIGRTDLQKKYAGFARVKMAELTREKDWLKEYGMHASADAVNTGLLSPEDHQRIYMDFFVNRTNRLSLSPFNQFFVLQALAKMNKYDEALSSMRDLWGGMIKNGGTTTYEVFRPSWNDIIEPNDPVPNSQSGIVSLCHPWGAGPVKWINEELVGIKPIAPGFSEYSIIPHPGRTLEWFKGTTPTPHGNISASFDLVSGVCSVSSPSGTVGTIGIPKIERSISKIFINGVLAWDGSYHEVDGIDRAWQDDEFVFFESVQAGDYEFEVSYQGSTSFYVEPHIQFPARYLGQDTLTSGNWGGVYGEDGYVLCNYDGNGKDLKSLPTYVKSVNYFRAFPRTEDHLPEALIWAENTSDQRAPARNNKNEENRSAACYSNTNQTMTLTVRLKSKRNFQVALYFVDWEETGSSQAVEIFDANTLNLISPVKMVDDFAGGKYLIYSYNDSVKFRINKIRGERVCLSGIFFDPR